MVADLILEDWIEYDKRKIMEEKDPNVFSCDDAWEIYYLKDKIKKEYPFIADLKILEAIESVSRRQNRDRKEFVRAVMINLGFY